MRALLTRRFSLAALLAVATLLFAVGVTAERSSADEHADPTVSAEAGEAGHADEGEGAEVAEEATGTRSEPSESSGEELLGVDPESTPLIVLRYWPGWR